MENVRGIEVLDKLNQMWTEIEGKDSKSTPQKDENINDKAQIQELKKYLSLGLSDYLIVASDSENVYLIEPSFVNVRVICKISFKNFKTNEFNANMGFFRLSIDKKVDGIPLILLGLHHSNLILACHIAKLCISQPGEPEKYDFVMKVKEIRFFLGEQSQHCKYFYQNLVGLEASRILSQGSKFGKLLIFVLSLQKKLQVLELEEEDIVKDFWLNIE